MTSAIVSPTVPPARIEHSTVVAGEPVALPGRSLGLGPFSVGTAKSGLPELVDQHGGRWGVFASEQLAAATAAHLAR